jgi:polyhydroxyalkanoate synthesis repressor PhaR
MKRCKTVPVASPNHVALYHYESHDESFIRLPKRFNILNYLKKRGKTKMPLNKLTFKKYPNRRLYDTENSTYVTLSDVAEVIKNGRQVEVIDLKTNEDVTAFILVQIIMEQVKINNNMLPVSLLHLIIRFGDDVLSEFFEHYLEKVIENYLTYKKSMEEQFKIYLELGMDFSTLTEKILKEQSQGFPSLFVRGTNEKRENKK